MLLTEALDAAGGESTLAVAPSWYKEILRQLWSTPGFKEDLTEMVRLAFWRQVWPRIRDERVKVSWWILRPSARVASFKWLFERAFGAEPSP